MFNADLNVMDMTLGVPTPEALEAGDAEPNVEVGLVTGIALPIANPETGAPVMVPGAILKFKLGKEDAIKLFEQGLKAAQELPDPKPKTNIMTATNLDAVTRAAEDMRRVTGR